jgi:hypothetical protein
VWKELLSVLCPDIFFDVQRLGSNLILMIAVKAKLSLKENLFCFFIFQRFSMLVLLTSGDAQVPTALGVFSTPYPLWEHESSGNS